MYRVYVEYMSVYRVYECVEYMSVCVCRGSQDVCVCVKCFLEGPTLPATSVSIIITEVCCVPAEPAKKIKGGGRAIKNIRASRGAGGALWSQWPIVMIWVTVGPAMPLGL